MAIRIPVSTKMVKHETRRITDEEEVTDFKRGHNWYFRFKKQNALSMITCIRLALTASCMHQTESFDSGEELYEFYYVKASVQ